MRSLIKIATIVLPVCIVGYIRVELERQYQNETPLEVKTIHQENVEQFRTLRRGDMLQLEDEELLCVIDVRQSKDALLVRHRWGGRSEMPFEPYLARALIKIIPTDDDDWDEAALSFLTK